MRSVRELLQLAGINMAALLERHEVMTACQHQLDRMPKPVGLALLRPFTCTPTGVSKFLKMYSIILECSWHLFHNISRFIFQSRSFLRDKQQQQHL